MPALYVIRPYHALIIFPTAAVFTFFHLLCDIEWRGGCTHGQKIDRCAIVMFVHSYSTGRRVSAVYFVRCVTEDWKTAESFCPWISNGKKRRKQAAQADPSRSYVLCQRHHTDAQWHFWSTRQRWHLTHPMSRLMCKFPFQAHSTVQLISFLLCHVQLIWATFPGGLWRVDTKTFSCAFNIALSWREQVMSRPIMLNVVECICVFVVAVLYTVFLHCWFLQVVVCHCQI